MPQIQGIFFILQFCKNKKWTHLCSCEEQEKKIYIGGEMNTKNALVMLNTQKP